MTSRARLCGGPETSLTASDCCPLVLYEDPKAGLVFELAFDLGGVERIETPDPLDANDGVAGSYVCPPVPLDIWPPTRRADRLLPVPRRAPRRLAVVA
jgi:hypothetical protein